jgi:hypothetical protein
LLKELLKIGAHGANGVETLAWVGANYETCQGQVQGLCSIRTMISDKGW